MSSSPGREGDQLEEYALDQVARLDHLALLASLDGQLVAVQPQPGLLALFAVAIDAAAGEDGEYLGGEVGILEAAGRLLLLPALLLGGVQVPLGLEGGQPRLAQDLLLPTQVDLQVLVPAGGLLLVEGLGRLEAHLGLPEIEIAQLGHPLELLQSRVGDLGAVQVEVDQLGKALQVLEPGVGDLGLLQVEPLQRGEAREVAQSFVGDAGVFQVQLHHHAQLRQDREIPVGEHSSLECPGREQHPDALDVLGDAQDLPPELLDLGPGSRLVGPEESQAGQDGEGGRQQSSDRIHGRMSGRGAIEVHRDPRVKRRLCRGALPGAVAGNRAVLRLQRVQAEAPQAAGRSEADGSSAASRMSGVTACLAVSSEIPAACK